MSVILGKFLSRLVFGSFLYPWCGLGGAFDSKMVIPDYQRLPRGISCGVAAVVEEDKVIESV